MFCFLIPPPTVLKKNLQKILSSSFSSKCRLIRFNERHFCAVIYSFIVSSSGVTQRDRNQEPPSDFESLSVEEGKLYPPAPSSIKPLVLNPQAEFPNSNGPQGLYFTRGREDPRGDQRNIQRPPYRTHPGRPVVLPGRTETSFFPEQQPPSHITQTQRQDHRQEQIGELVEDEELPRYKMDADPRG